MSDDFQQRGGSPWGSPPGGGNDGNGSGRGPTPPDVDKIIREFQERIKGHRMVRNSRVKGTILAFDINTEKDTSYFNEARHHLYPYFIDKGLLIRPLGNVIYLIPPYIISDEELEYVYSTIMEFLDSAR